MPAASHGYMYIAVVCFIFAVQDTGEVRGRFFLLQIWIVLCERIFVV